MTEIEIETYSSESYSEEESVEYSVVLITPDDQTQDNDKKVTFQSDDITFSSEQDDRESFYNSYQSNDSIQKENLNFSQFIKRQNAANKRQIKNRDHPPTERRFNPPPFKFKLKTAIPPPKTESSISSKQYPSLFQRSINRSSNVSKNNYSFQKNDNNLLFSNAHYEESNDYNYKSMNSSVRRDQQNISEGSFLNEPFKNFDVELFSKNSESIANGKDTSLIINKCGNRDVINLFQLRQICRRFLIKDENLISEICAITEIKDPSELNTTLNRKQRSIYENRIDQSDDRLYNNQILKKLLIHSITEDQIKNLSNLEIKLRKCISVSLLNDKTLTKRDRI